MFSFSDTANEMTDDCRWDKLWSIEEMGKMFSISGGQREASNLVFK